MRLGQLRVRPPSNSNGPKTITPKLPDQNLNRARNQAAKKGANYETCLNQLLHDALANEETKLAS